MTHGASFSRRRAEPGRPPNLTATALSMSPAEQRRMATAKCDDAESRHDVAAADRNHAIPASDPTTVAQGDSAITGRFVAVAV
jgi:hypothetical protein